MARTLDDTQTAALRTEILTNPASMDYDDYVDSEGTVIADGFSENIADMLNALDGVGVGLVPVQNITFPELREKTMPAIVRLRNKSAEIQAGWDRVCAEAAELEDGVVDADCLTAILDGMVEDSLLTQQQADAIASRTGSRGEVLFGAGADITSDDVSFAIRGE